MAAQAARLGLRMQKELKLLLSDPPPGACFPRLSDDSDFSLSSIDAQIKGPEGSVYENGVFNIKIRIPDRYPFQPPIVTFVTPIYHPNIDTGGRICLDILNLPPKGAWQPSLNISTVLTSLGLLLSEPNPDDGLMCEASREFKYNRQAFDQKARSMTEKHAHPEPCENIGINMEAKPTENESKPDATRKSTLESLRSCKEMVDNENENEASYNDRLLVKSSNNQNEIEGAQKELNSLEPSSHSGKSDNVKEDMESKKLQGILPTQPLGSTERIRVFEEKMEKDDDLSCFENGSFGTIRRKLSLGGKKLCLGLTGSSDTCNKENVKPVLESGNSSTCLPKETQSLSGPIKSSTKQQDIDCVKKLKSEPLEPEEVIVLDSEDSEDEENKSVYLRSKPMLARKRLGKWKR